MKIKTKKLSYDEVMALPRAEHKLPQRPMKLLSEAFRLATGGDLRQTGFSYKTERMEELGPGPYLILMNHSSFIDLEIAAEIFRHEPYCIVCTSDGFVGKESVMRAIGCIPTNKFVSDLQLVSDMDYALKQLKCSVLLYPEASYSFDGTATPLPRGLGLMLRRLGVPVVGVKTEGAFTRDPLYNCLQKRSVTVSATVQGLLTREELKEKTVPELDRLLDEFFTFDHFAWQREKQIAVDEPFRADGLERILYKCPHCLSEGQTEGKGTKLCCRACGKGYELDRFGVLKAKEGESAFTHIPAWYAWEREQVKEEIRRGDYGCSVPVEIGMLVDFKAIYMVGEGTLRHSAEGFHLTGCGGKLDFVRPAKLNYSLYADYYWYELGDIVCIGDASTQYYCFPKDKTPVAKLRLAAEELYKRLRDQKPKPRRQNAALDR